MNVALIISGGAWAIFVISLVLAVLFTPIVLHRYRVAVKKHQCLDSAELLSLSASSLKQKTIDKYNEKEIEISFLKKKLNWGVLQYLAFSQIDKLVWKKAIIYSLGGGAYSSVLVCFWAYYFDVPSVLDLHYFISNYFLFVVILWIITSASLLGSLIVLAAYVIVLLYSSIFYLGGDFSAFFNTNGITFVILIVFLSRRMRFIGYMCFTFFFGTLLGAYCLRWIGQYQNLFYDWLGVNQLLDFIMTLLIATPITGTLGWLSLKYVGKQYHSKIISDERLMINTMVLTAAIGHSAYFFNKGFIWVIIVILSFAAYLVVTGMLLKLLFKDGGVGTLNPKSVLYLRVFDLGAKGEKFFISFSNRWRSIGYINLISGVDLIKTTIEPHEFYEYLSGRVSRQFVRNEADLVERVEMIDTLPDADGRYRVNEFFCQNHTWKMTMKELSYSCEAVLMDLRSFSSKNRGCLYEIEQLIDLVDLERVIFMIDDTTDTAYLENQMRTIWEQVTPDSPNMAKENPVIRLYDYRWSVTGRYLFELEHALQFRDCKR